MRNVLDSIWWWTRLVVLVLVGVYILALLFNNSGQTATLWYWVGRQSDNIPIITIVLVSFLAGGVVSITAWALTSAMLTYRRTREERRGRAERERLEAMHRKAGMLRTKPAPTPVVRRPPEDRPRTLPSLDATPDETNARFDDDEAAPTSFPRGDESVDETTDEPPMTEPTSLPMPPMPLAARPAEPLSPEAASDVDADLAMAPSPLIERAIATAETGPDLADRVDPPADPQAARDARNERILGARLPPPSPPPAGG